MNLSTFIEKWSSSSAAERANKDAFLIEFCDVVGVPRPDATTGNLEHDLYVFERDALLLHDDGTTAVGKIDLYKSGAFLLEAKQGSTEKSKKLGTARRGTAAWFIAMQEAFGQGLQYAATIDDPPPFLVVTDIGYCFDIYACFDGRRVYRPFPNAQTHRIFLNDLAAHVETFRAIWLDPWSLDPSKVAAKVTREVAGQLANLAKHLEDDGHEPEQVAKFLMRVVFTCFAEDTGLLPADLFKEALEKLWIPNPKTFPAGVETLWAAMNDGAKFGFVGKLLRFNGGLFAEPRALPLTKDALLLLALAAGCNWADVEPAIFGTLLERALNPKERHALGAHYTPRAYVERLVRATIEEPLRAEWDATKAQVYKLVPPDKPEDKKNIKDAQKLVREFHRKLRTTRVLDPACGTGNFLYVTLDLFKRLESEIFALLDGLGDKQALLDLHAVGTVSPGQFFGLEVKPWAREIAELVLWIGYLQWHFRARGKVAPPEPVLCDYGNIIQRDAVLAFDSVDEVLGRDGKPETRWDGETQKISPVTGERVPDERARVPVLRYLNPRRAEWPEADYVVGNPPFIGNHRMRNALGSGYVDALRDTHQDVPETSDYVMYWWNQAANLLRTGKISRFGLITTNSITQPFNRKVVQRYLDEARGLSLAFAIPDHPWVDSSDGADVRIAMTVAEAGTKEGILGRVTREVASGDDSPGVEFSYSKGTIHADLRTGADVTSAAPLEANAGLSCPGVKLHGAGFIVTHEEARKLGLGKITEAGRHIRPYLNGRDLTAKTRGLLVIDLFGLSETQVREKLPAVYQWVLERVKPERDQNNRATYRQNWWIFGEPRADFRPALAGLRRYVVTVETSRHRFFTFLDGKVLPDNKLIAIATDDAYHLGVLSSRIHVVWALATGGRLGVGNDPVYVKTACFEKFPFPEATPKQHAKIIELAEALDAHRKRQQSAYAGLTLTATYNALEVLRRGEPLNGKDKAAYEQGLVSVLRQLHDDLDRAVATVYGLSPSASDEEILQHLVALNEERHDEEARGKVRWLRPEFQASAGKGSGTLPLLKKGGKPAAGDSLLAWPKGLPDQLAAVREIVRGASRAWTVQRVAVCFKRARRKEVEAALESLAALGLVIEFDTAKGRQWRASGLAVA